MISKTDSSIDIVKNVAYVHLIGTKAVLYPLLFQQFPIKHRDHFNTVNTLELVESEYLQT